MTSTLRLVVFDCDGTLVDSQHGIVAAAEAAWRVHGLPVPDPSAVRQVVGLNLDEAIAVLQPDADAHLLGRLVEAYKQAFFTLRSRPDHHEPLYPGIAELLAALDRPEILLGIATGKNMRGLRATLARHDLAGRFVTLQTPDTCRGKPHPEMVERALAETGVTAMTTYVIGDTTYDMQMAYNAGVAGIGVGWGYHVPAALLAAGARQVIDHPLDLADILMEFERVAR
jgi:phosphoglycolate phosphatase